MKPSECREQAHPEIRRRAWTGSGAKIQKASFVERRLFFSFLQAASVKLPDFAVQLCYKGMQ
jgi:hypothetical protein